MSDDSEKQEMKPRPRTFYEAAGELNRAWFALRDALLEPLEPILVAPFRAPFRSYALLIIYTILLFLLLLLLALK